jgi:hypothetical protein
MRMLVIALSLLALSSTRADAEGTNWLIGPVFGIRLGSHAGSDGVFGVEGGVGAGPERLNLGFEHRDDKVLGYVELDPWLLVGGTLGFGVDSEGDVQPVLGIWEGLPIKDPSCSVPSSQYQTQVTIAGGYRYTGVHELYFTIKAGVAQNICFPTD